MTPTEETMYYSAKIHNTAETPRKVKCYYKAPEKQEMVEEVQIIEPKKQAVFAPRTYKIEEGKPERKYKLEKVELHPVEATEKVEPVQFIPASEYKVEKPSEAVTLHIKETDGAYRFHPAQAECCEEKVILTE